MNFVGKISSLTAMVMDQDLLHFERIGHVTYPMTKSAQEPTNSGGANGGGGDGSDKSTSG